MPNYKSLQDKDVENTKVIKRRQRWKRQSLRYRQKFQAYIAYIAIIALFSIVLPINIYYHFSLPFFFMNILLSIAIALYIGFSKREFVDRASWLIIVIALPFFGALLFIFIGASQTQSRTYKMKISTDAAYRAKYEEQITGLPFKTIEDFSNEHFMTHFYYLAKDASYTIGNKFQFLTGQAVYDAMLKDILQAKDHIHLEMYIARNDGTTKAIFDALKMKASQGVQVRYLGDILGHNLLSQKDIEAFILSGIEFVFFNQGSKSYFDHFHVNHRKMLIVDGKVGYTGGYNLGNEYVDGYPKKNLLWYDMMVRMEGNIVAPMQMMFLSDWTFSYKQSMDTLLESRLTQFFPQTITPIVTTSIQNQPKVTQFMGDGPDYEKTKVKDTLRYLISRAEKKIYMTTPYLIPSTDLLNDLILAAQSGVDVRIVIPGVPDKKTVYYCSESYIEPLMEAGVKIYKMDGHFIHSKMYLFDDVASMFGTVNFDMRSFMLNFEENIIQFNDEVVNAEILQLYKDVEARSTLLSEEQWKKRRLSQKFLELFFRAFSPLF